MRSTVKSDIGSPGQRRVSVHADTALLRWGVAIALAAVGFILYGAGTYGFIMFAAPIAAEFRWSEAAVGGLVSAFWLTAPISLAAGKLIQRFGPRRLILTGIVLEGLCFAAMVFATQLWQLYVLRALSGLGKVLFAITVPITVSKLFSRRYGLAVSINYAGWQLGGVVIAPLAALAIDHLGWRPACIAMGVLVFAAIVPALWLTDVAERAIKEPELESGEGQRADVYQSKDKNDVRYQDILRVPGFFFLLIGNLIFFTVYGGVLAHQPAAVMSTHVPRYIASLALASTAGFGAIGALSLGWLVDRLSQLAVTLILFVLFIGGVASLVALVSGGSATFLIIHTICFGLGVGGCDVFWISTIKRNLRSEMFPAGWGLGYFSLLVGLVIGPMVAGALNDTVHSFTITLSVQAAALFIPFAICLRLALGRKRGIAAGHGQGRSREHSPAG